MIIDFSVILIVLSVVIILFIQNNMNIIILEMRYEHMQKEILKKLSLLSISLVLTSTTAIASAIPLMQETFVHQSLAPLLSPAGRFRVITAGLPRPCFRRTIRPQDSSSWNARIATCLLRRSFDLASSTVKYRRMVPSVSM